MRPARGHRPDEHAGVEADRFHANPVAEQRAAGEGAGGIDRDDRHFETALAIGANQLFGERALARAGRSGDADAMGASLPDLLVQRGQHALEAVALVLDQTDRTGEGSDLAAFESGQNVIGTHLPQR